MPSFPFLKLPELSQLHVLKNSNLDDFFVFSLASKRAKKLAIAVRRSIDNLSWVLDSMGDDENQNQIRLSDGLNFYVPMLKSLDEARQTENAEEWELNGLLVPMYRNERTWYFEDRNQGIEHYFELLDLLSKHILEVFQCQYFQFMTSSPSAPEDLFVFKHTRKFTNFMYFIPESDVNLQTSLPAEHVKFALEQLEVRDCFFVEPPVPGFQWVGPLKMELLRAHDAGWLTFEALMSNECMEIVTHGHTFTAAELNGFLHKWIAGGFPNLEYCMLSGNDSDRATVLQGIETLPYNLENRPDYHPRYDEDLSYGVDIRRNDGILATFDYSLGTLILAVWINL